MVINFYLERQALPNAVTHEITPDGTIGRETEVSPENLNNSLVRFIDTGVVMSYENARIFHSWLGDKLREVESAQAANAEFEGAEGAGQA